MALVFKEVPAPVLVVDDDASVRRFLSVALRTAGYEVVEASDGRQALELVAVGSFGLILLDIGLPGLGGLEVLARIRANPDTARLPVILVTGADEVEDRVAGLDAEANDYVTKPFAAEELLARVRAHLRTRSVWAEAAAEALDQRARAVRSLGRAAVQSTPEAIAAAICEGMLEVDGVASSAIVWFSGAGPALTLAAVGGTASPLRAGQALPGALGRYLGVRASVGPWIEVGDMDPEGDDASTSLLLGGNTACAPIGTRAQCIGVLLLGIEPDASLRAAHSVLSAAIDFAGPAEEMLRDSLHQRNLRRGSWLEIATIVADGLYQTHYQPVVRLDDRQVVGHEALTRFADGSSSEDRFIQAAAFGRGLELEEATLTRALSSCAHLPQGTWLGLNVSPKMLLQVDYLHPLIEGTGRDVVLELSEHEPVEDYAELRSAVDRLAGEMLLSVDDAGAGFASLRHVLLLRPTFMKLDRSWTHGVDTDPAKTALVAGLQSYASKTGCRLIAEGIETEGQLEALGELGVELGQGYLLGRPAAPPQ